MKRVKKAGGIVLNQAGDVLVVTSIIGKRTLPKGSPEPGESDIQAARREIWEESGLSELTFKKDLGILSRPGYTRENHRAPSVLKQIHLFLFTTQETRLQPQASDVMKAEWINQASVAGLLSWPEEVDFFNKHHDKLTL